LLPLFSLYHRASSLDQMLSIDYWEFWKFVDSVKIYDTNSQIKSFRSIQAAFGGGDTAKQLIGEWETALSSRKSSEPELTPEQRQARKKQGVRKMAAIAKAMGMYKGAIQ